MNISQQYVSALAVILVGVLKLVGIEIGTDEISTLIMVALSLWIAIRRKQKGDITMLGGFKR